MQEVGDVLGRGNSACESPEMRSVQLWETASGLVENQ